MKNGFYWLAGGSTVLLEHAMGNHVTRARELTPGVSAAIDDAFLYHRWDDAMTAKGTAVREVLAEAVKVIVANVPPSPDRSAAIRKLREARMDCNSAITHGGKY